MHRLNCQQPDFDQRLQDLLQRSPDNVLKVEQITREIIAEVRHRGDAAVLDFAQKYDHSTAHDIATLTIPPSHFEQALHSLPIALAEALQVAADRILDFHKQANKRFTSWSYDDHLGNNLGQRFMPLEKVGFYIPGGQASYPSSILMSLIPAAVAGVNQRYLICPLGSAEQTTLVLAAAHLAAASMVYGFGGAHGIAALAYGTESIAKVDKIIGPGGIYVSEAKRQVFGQVGIDMIAGPTEITILSDGSVAPDLLAIDMLAQAEHDASAQAIIISPYREHLDAVEANIKTLTASQPRAAIIQQSLNNNGVLIQCTDLPSGIDISNSIAPEHLELAILKPASLLPLVKHAGAIFLGRHSAEVYGDYVAGPSHVLPTGGTARFSSSLGIQDFGKYSSTIQISSRGAKALAPHAMQLATAEGLVAHALAAKMRSAVG